MQEWLSSGCVKLFLASLNQFRARQDMSGFCYFSQVYFCFGNRALTLVSSHLCVNMLLRALSGNALFCPSDMLLVWSVVFNSWHFCLFGFLAQCRGSDIHAPCFVFCYEHTGRVFILPPCTVVLCVLLNTWLMFHPSCYLITCLFAPPALPS